MLGVFKRRWKPKRNNSSNRVSSSDSISLEGDKLRLTHQIHPVLEACHLVGYDLTERTETPPPQAPQRCLPLAPNICVESGRIQFVKHDGDSETNTSALTTASNASSTPSPTSNVVSIGVGHVTVTRGVQTDDDEFRHVHNYLENRIIGLEDALENAQKIDLRNKQTINKLTKQLKESNRRESIQKDVNRERQLRVDSELRTKRAIQETARCRSKLKLLSQELNRMEEAVRSMLIYQKQVKQLRQEKTTLTLAYEGRCQQYQSTITRLNLEITTLRHQLDQISNENGTEGILHAAALKQHVDESRKLYERCLDDVANQVVRALLTQKDLKEEVTCLNNRIQELETQNGALLSLLLHQLQRGNNNLEEMPYLDTFTRSKPLTIDGGTSPILNTNAAELLSPTQKRHSDNVALTSSCIDTRFLSDSFDIFDGKLERYANSQQILSHLRAEFGSLPQAESLLFDASVAWATTTPKRPNSLNLHLPILQSSKCNRKIRQLLVDANSTRIENETETDPTTGNESPESSGNRDEGYSTMSSDIGVVLGQNGDMTRASTDSAALPLRILEDVKEATDETDLNSSTIIDNHHLLLTDNNNKETNILYIPVNLFKLKHRCNNAKQRNSFPPDREIQHIMRSFSDSHLFINITTTPSPYYSFTTPISNSPSLFFFDVNDESSNPIANKTSTLLDILGQSRSELNKCELSWTPSTDTDNYNCGNNKWDTEYIEQWLRLDEKRSSIQHRDLLELEYDQTELEDWSLSLSSDEYLRRNDALTPGQISISTLPSIQENNALELEEDANECLWNNSSYMLDKDGRELVRLLMDNSNKNDKQWPYATSNNSNNNNNTINNNGNVNQELSPATSWSSGGSDSYRSHEPENYSKRSSGASDDTSINDFQQIGTDFTRDFYRLIKFESTKSLASSSRSIVNGENGENLQNFLTLISEHHQKTSTNSSPQYNKERPHSVNDIIKELTSQHTDEKEVREVKNAQSDYNIAANKTELNKLRDDENYVTLRELCEEFECKDKASMLHLCAQKLSYAQEVAVATTLGIDSETCSNINQQPVGICTSVVLESGENGAAVADDDDAGDAKKADITLTDVDANTDCISSTSTAIINQSTELEGVPPSRTHSQKSRIPISPARLVETNLKSQVKESCLSTKMVKSKIPRKSNNRSNNKPKIHLPEPVQTLSESQITFEATASSPRFVSCRNDGDAFTVEDPSNYGHLHNIHMHHRQKKAKAIRHHPSNAVAAVVKASIPPLRPTIIGRTDFYVRYGEQEQEAVASFDFLNEFSSSSSCSMEDGNLESDVVDITHNLESPNKLFRVTRV